MGCENCGKKGKAIAQVHGFIPYKRMDTSRQGFNKENPRNAGYDLFARLDEPIHLAPGEVAVIPLNVATEIPMEAVGLLFQRSSTYRKWKVKLTNGVGVMDSLFCGDGDEWAAEFKNETDKPTTIYDGDKVCQAVFLPLFMKELYEVAGLGNADRGGFGTSFDNAGEMNS
ncbi:MULTISPECIES: dUTP diphosphatase [unclassified Paenibacillus]|uniref:dUTP diphosphatase n=1 Tax=unclassified Paenibacillus TaxID=185978 RepID=UPI00089BB30A|nr:MULTISPECIES: hypothetical protein [unclassified Paenibacillus]OMC68593.1 hypothetical protein BK126_12250 [Paenibacillus sp. FSL H7-0326]SDW57764.1 dUTP pyrophosphatase [Paenibacillus sp. PDC88]